MAPEGAAICPNCEGILDSSLLETDQFEPVDEDKTDVGPAPTSLMPDRLRKAAAKRPRGNWTPAATAPARAAAEPRRPYLSEPSAPAPSPADEARKAAADLASFFRRLSPADRWASAATALLLLMLALPWRWTKEDEEIIGIISAWPLLLLGGAVLVMVYLRSRKAGSALDRQLRFAQLAAAAAAALFTGLYLYWSSQTHVLRALGRGVAIIESTPAVGAYLGLVFAIAALFASIPALRGD
jgi:hypothetical protein